MIQDLIGRLTDEARKEYKIETALKEIANVWNSLKLEITPYKDQMIKMEANQEVLATLEEHLLALATIKSDQFHMPFKDTVLQWETSLTLVSEMMELLQHVQKQWMYLRNVFRGTIVDATFV